MENGMIQIDDVRIVVSNIRFIEKINGKLLVHLCRKKSEPIALKITIRNVDARFENISKILSNDGFNRIGNVILNIAHVSYLHKDIWEIYVVFNHPDFLEKHKISFDSDADRWRFLSEWNKRSSQTQQL